MFLFGNNGYIENHHRPCAEQCRNNNAHTAIHRGLAGGGWGVPVALDKAAGAADADKSAVLAQIPKMHAANLTPHQVTAKRGRCRQFF